MAKHGQTKFWRQSFWMRAHGHPTAKRTLVWSNSTLITRLHLGKMAKKLLASTVQVVDRYRNKDGKLRWKGNSKLKSTQ